MNLGAQAHCSTCLFQGCQQRAQALERELQEILSRISGPAALWWPCPRGVHPLAKDWPDLPEVALTLALPADTPVTPNGPSLLALWPGSELPAEEAHQLSECLKQSLGDIDEYWAGPEVHWLMTEDLHRVLFCSPNYEQLFGLSLSELYEDPSSFLAAVHPDDRQRTVEDLHHYLQDDSLEHQVSYRVVKPDGRVCQVSTRITRLKTEFGVVIAGYCYPYECSLPPLAPADPPLLSVLLSQLEQALGLRLAVGRPRVGGGLSWQGSAGRVDTPNDLPLLAAGRPILLNGLPPMAALDELLNRPADWIYGLPEQALLAIGDPSGAFLEVPCESVGPGVARLVSLHLRGPALPFGEVRNHLAEVRDEVLRGLARELHDELGQLLTAVKLQVLRLRQTRAPRKLVAELDHLSSEALDSLRRLTRRLRAPVAEEEGLVEALKNRADQLERISGLTILVEGALDERHLSPPARLALLRIAQEGLTNCLRHSGARKVSLRLSETDHEVALELEDDGQGCSQPGNGLGLVHIRERVEQLGGRFTIENRPGQGFRLQVTIPI